MDTILDYLDAIEEIIESGRPVHFSNRISIDSLRLTEILQEIRLNLPAEIDRAQKIVQDHERIVEDAKRKRYMLLEDAQAEANALADEHEIYKMACERGEEIIENAKRDAKEMRQNAVEYADEILEKVEKSIREAMQNMNKTTRSIDELFNNNLELIYSNRQELQVNTKRQ